MRRLPLFVSAVLLLAGSVTAAALRTSDPVARGDVNADGEINAIDALAILSHVVGKELPDGFTVLPNGDTNGDGQVTALDALIVLGYAVGEDVSAFPIGEPLEPAARVASVSVAPDSADLMVGSTLQLVATPRDSTNAPVEGAAVVWSSSDTTRASVAADGTVTAIAMGEVTVTASSDGQEGIALIRVIAASGSMRIDVAPRQATVLVDGTLQLDAVVRDGAGNPIAGRDIEWSSLDPEVASVSDAGLVTGLAYGTARIQAASDTLSATATISVVEAAARANRTWTGAQSDDWGAAANWDPVGVPIATDTILVPAGGLPRFQGASSMIAGLVVQPGASLDIGEHELQVSGRLDVDGEVTGVGRITVQGVHGQESYVRGRLPGLNINGTTVIVGPTIVDGALELNPSSVLEINGHTVRVSENLTIRGGLRMRERTDTVDVRGDARFFNDAASTDALLEAGTLRVGGDLTVDVPIPSAASPFPARGEHRLVLDGNAPQRVRNVGLSVLTLQEFDILNTGGEVEFTADPADRIRVQGSLDAATPAALTGDGRLNVLGDFTTAPGGSVSLLNLAVRGMLAAGSGFRPDTLTLLGREQLIPAGAAYDYQHVVVAGSARFAGQTGIAGDLLLGCLTQLSDCDGGSASLDLDGRTVTVSGDLRQTAMHPTSPLYMRDPAGRLTVRGGLLGPVGVMAGAIEFTADSLDWTAGTLRVGGDFRARGTGASGAHLTILDGPELQTLRVLSGFHFQTLQIADSAGVVMNDTTPAAGRHRVIGVRGDFSINTAVPLTGTGRLDVAGSVETVPGSSVEIGALSVGAILRASGTFKPDTAEFNNPGTAQTIQNNPDYRNVVVRGRAVFGGSMTFAGSLIVLPGAELNVEGRHVTVSENLKVAGILRMQDARDSLTVLGDSAVFYARGDENARAYATEGVLRVAGHVSIDSTGFYPTRNHKVVFAGGSHRTARGVFHHLEVAATSEGGGVTLRDLVVRGNLVGDGSSVRITVDTLVVDGSARLAHSDTVLVRGPAHIAGDLVMRNLRSTALGALRVGGDLRIVDGGRLQGYVHHRGRYIEEGEVVDPQFARPMLEGLRQLRWVQQPTASSVGVPFDPPVSVELVDSAGERLTRGSAVVWIDAGATALSGPTRAVSVDGVATFEALTPERAYDDLRLQVRTTTPDGNLGGWYSASFAVAPPPPAPVSGGIAFAAVSGGGAHSCGLTAAGQAYCWGSGESGRLGTGDDEARDTPTAVVGGLAFTEISAGYAHTCGVTTTGAIRCWGNNEYSQLGDASTTDAAEPVAVAGDLVFTSVGVGYSHSCGLATTGAAYCWGQGGAGRLGTGSTFDQPEPTPVTGGHTFAAISVGTNHACALTPDGAAYCWGYNSGGQLGDGSTTQSLSPVAVAGDHTFRSIAAGGAHTCAITETGAAYCWGTNSDGQLGLNHTGARTTPNPVVGGHSFQGLTAGQNFTCGVTTAGQPYCWGRNASGQLGDGSVTNRPRPTAVVGDLVVTTMSAGFSHTLAITQEGVTMAW